jgi:hypothetical protein
VQAFVDYFPVASQYEAAPNIITVKELDRWAAKHGLYANMGINSQRDLDELPKDYGKLRDAINQRRNTVRGIINDVANRPEWAKLTGNVPFAVAVNKHGVNYRIERSGNHAIALYGSFDQKARNAWVNTRMRISGLIASAYNDPDLPPSHRDEFSVIERQLNGFERIANSLFTEMAFQAKQIESDVLKRLPKPPEGSLGGGAAI